jgi:hypothetical protein
MKYLLLCVGLMCFYLMGEAQTTYTFDNSTDLATYFNAGSTSSFTDITSNGLGGSGCVYLYQMSDLWTGKTACSAGVITLSAYFYNYANSGYGGIGIAPANTNDRSGLAYPSSGLGIVFHGGGGMFINDGTSTNVSWSSDIAIGSWYKMTLIITRSGANTYDLKFQIWNSDTDGNNLTLFTEKVLTGVVNDGISAASDVYPYFSAYGYRFSYMDNFSATTGAVTAPALTTQDVTGVGVTTATGNGTITDLGSSAPSQYGVVWSTSANPDVSLSTKTEQGTVTTAGAFTSSITGLTPGETYYVRAYATNWAGTSYGNQVSFTTTEDSPVISELQSPQSGCEGGSLQLSYTVLSGAVAEYQITFSEAALAAGFADIDYTSAPASTGTGVIGISVPEGAYYGTYTAQLQLRSPNKLESASYPFTFTINISSDYVVDKFNDVVLCDNSSGLFNAYQWYKNDALISGATNQYYCDPAGLSGTYYVKVSTTDGEKLQTCPVTYEMASGKKATLNIYPNPVQLGNTITIEVAGVEETDLEGAVMHIYDMSGAEVFRSCYLNVLNSTDLKGQYGNYIVRITTSAGMTLNGKVSVLK